MDVVTEHVQRVPGKPFVRIFPRKWSGKVSERQSRASRTTTCSEMTHPSLRTLTCSNTKPGQHHIAPIAPGAGSALPGRGSSSHSPAAMGTRCSCSPLHVPVFIFPPLAKYCGFLPPAAGHGVLGCGIVFLGKEGASEYMCPKGVKPVKTGVIKL